jgi:hypothetical protein
VYFHATRDILDNIQVSHLTPSDAWDVDDDREFIEEALEEITPVAIFTAFLSTCLVIIKYIESTAGVGFISGVGVAAVAAWIAAIVTLRVSVDAWLDSGLKGKGWAAWMYLICGLECLAIAFAGQLALVIAILGGSMYPPARAFLYTGASALVVGSIAIRLVMILTALLLFSFAVQMRVGSF